MHRNKGKNIDVLEFDEDFSIFVNPLAILKKGLSSFLVMFFIALGSILNIIFLFVMLYLKFKILSWLNLLAFSCLIVIIFPAAYLYFAYKYGFNALAWDAYKQVLRPSLSAFFTTILNEFLLDKEQSNELTESELEKKIQNKNKSILEKLPRIFKNKLGLIYTIADIIAVRKEQKNTGLSKEKAKNKVLIKIFDIMDSTVAQSVEPSYKPALFLFLMNIIVFILIIIF